MRDTAAYLQSFARFPLALRAQREDAQRVTRETQTKQVADFSYLNAVLDEIGRVPALGKVEGPR